MQKPAAPRLTLDQNDLLDLYDRYGSLRRLTLAEKLRWPVVKVGEVQGQLAEHGMIALDESGQYQRTELPRLPNYLFEETGSG